MSSVSTIYDRFVTRLGVLLPNHLRLPNPYEPAENNALFLKQGYGVKIGQGTNTNRVISNQLSIDRAYLVVITRQFFALESDAASKASTEKQLIEDSLLLIKDLESDPSMGGLAMNASYQSDDGINAIFTEKDQYLSTTVTINVEYLESLI